MKIQRILESYPTRQIRVSDEVWSEFEKDKLNSGLSWNLFIVKLLEDKKKL